MPYQTQHRGFEARAPYNTVEPVKEEEELKGSKFLDTTGQKIQETIANAAADQEGIGDDIVRLGLGGLKNIGHVTNLPGIKQGLQILGAPVHYAGQAIGAGLEHGLGIDPRFGHALAEGVEMAIPGLGAYKVADKLGDFARYTKRASQLDPITRGMLVGNRPVGAAGIAMNTPANNLKAALQQTKQDLGLPHGPWQKAPKKIATGDMKYVDWTSDVRDIIDNPIYSSKQIVSKVTKQIKKPYHKTVKQAGYERVSHAQIAKNPELLDWLMQRQEKMMEGLVGYQLGTKRTPTQIRATFDNYTANLNMPDADLYRNQKLKGLLESTFHKLQGEEYHHIFGSADAAKVFLSEIVQDPYMTANVMAQLAELDLPTGASWRNFGLMAKKPHRKRGGFHSWRKKQGFEGRGNVHDVGEYIEAVSNEVLAGNTDASEIFGILEAYKSLNKAERDLMKRSYQATVLDADKNIDAFFGGPKTGRKGD